jgi:tetratricopeptide (TPR) repeat protein
MPDHLKSLGIFVISLLALVQGVSTKKDVDEAMREGEAAFAKGEFPKALEHYQRALLLDPKLYEAALMMGDIYFKSAEQDKAGEWFARAIEINPDRETAYRYWGDSLMKQGRVSEAGDKFVESYIAEPYSREARAGFIQYAERVKVSLAHPRVEVPTSIGSSAAWVTYGLVRANWASTEFLKQYPDEKSYRHSLKEEAAAMRAAIKAKDVDPSLQIIRKLEKEGLLEAFILLALPDEGIAKDFKTYRTTNIENLRRYVKQYVLTNGGQ